MSDQERPKKFEIVIDADDRPDDLMWTVVAGKLFPGVTNAMIRQMVFDGKIRGYRFGVNGRRILISKKELLASFEQVEVGGKKRGIGPSAREIAKKAEKAMAYLKSRGIG